MSLNVPDFLAPSLPRLQEQSASGNTRPITSTSNVSSTTNTPYASHGINTSHIPVASGSRSSISADASLQPDFDVLRAKLSNFDDSLPQPYSGLPLLANFPPVHPFAAFGPTNTQFDAFTLPSELQGGIGTISLRRPSYAAELFTRSPQGMAPGGRGSLAQFAAANNYSLNHQAHFGFDQLTDLLLTFLLNNNLSEFQARRPLQVAEYPVPQQSFQGANFAPKFSNLSPSFSPAYLGLPRSQDFSGGSPQLAPASGVAGAPPGIGMPLDNGLLLKDQYIMASGDLKALYGSTARYFHDSSMSSEVMTKLRRLLARDVVVKMVSFIRNLNNLTFNHKLLCLVVNKNGKLDLLLYPGNSNICLQHEDLVIVDGDRGKDLVMILEPLVPLNMAILFNFLKKLDHLKSLTIVDGSSVKNNHCGGTHLTQMKASAIINSHSNEDNEFIITLPTKQVLRFATPKEVQKLSGKFLEEKKAFITCYNKIKELGLNNDLKLINVEYQCDFKKLIFYYFANFKRIDFRGLIKELFKIYKTRIWLCAVLPADRPDLYTNRTSPASKAPALDGVPCEYDLSNEQIMNFSVAEFAKLPQPSYFHLKNMLNLIDGLEEDVKGSFYGFNVGTQDEGLGVQPKFDPFGDAQKF